MALVLGSPVNVFANAADPTKSGVWPLDFVGTYWFHDMSTGWMRTAVNAASTSIGHIDARNPDFHVSTSSSATGDVHFWPASQNSCDGSTTWTGCADAYTNRTFRLWLSSERCWTDGTNSTCTNRPRYDVQTVALNEFGHVNRLGHHLPEATHDVDAASYADAVVQAYPDPVGHPFGTRRAFQWADHDALHRLYPCAVQCPTSPDI